MPSTGTKGTIGYLAKGKIQGGYVSYLAESQKYTETYGRVVDKEYEKATMEELVKHLTRYKMLHRVRIFGRLPNGTLEYLFSGFKYYEDD